MSSGAAPRASAQVRPGPPGPARQEEPSTVNTVLRFAGQFAVIWLVSQAASQFFLYMRGGPTASVTPVVSTNTLTPPSPASSITPAVPSLPARPLWALGTNLDMHVYLSTSPSGHTFEEDEGLPHFKWADIWYGNWKEAREADVNVKMPESVMHNGSLWADIYVTADRASPDPHDSTFNPQNVYHTRKMLTRYWPKRRARKEKNLIAGGQEPEEEEEEEFDPKEKLIVPYWHPNLTLALISETPEVSIGAQAPATAPYVDIAPWTREPGGRPMYYPVVYPNDFWILREHMTEINSTTPILPLHVSLYPLSWMKFNIYGAMNLGFEQQAAQGGAAAEIDEIKRMLIETNPILLGTTFLVTMLHMLFEFLAFKNDIMHWRKKDELVGVSVRTIVANVVVQLIILLYLIDNSVETSWMILFSQGMGLLVEAWKITKAVDIALVQTPPGSTLPYWIKVTDKHVLSEDEKKTQEYDQLAFRYVSYVAIPTLAAYTVYSLIYETHRGWYSFIITTLTSFVYMFGFVQLIPQLIINYKLKSVSHMPMKSMIYKTLSTVVDDFFAFCIKMPWLHRLACFRDDAVFVVFLYQRWIYRVDPKRANEYGQIAVDGIQDDKLEETKDVKIAEEESKKTR